MAQQAHDLDVIVRCQDRMLGVGNNSFKAALGLLYGAVVLAALVLAPLKADRATLVALSFLLLLIAATTPWWAKLPHGIKVALRVPYLLLFVTQVVRTARGF